MRTKNFRFSTNFDRLDAPFYRRAIKASGTKGKIEVNKRGNERYPQGCSLWISKRATSEEISLFYYKFNRGNAEVMFIGREIGAKGEPREITEILPAHSGFHARLILRDKYEISKIILAIPV
jgi:hypothetical protein